MKPMLFLFAFTCFLGSSRAENILNCIENQTTTIGWEKSKGVLVAESNKASEKPTQITLVVTKTGAILKGNLGQGSLKRIGKKTFTEETESGNLVMYTLLESEHPQYPFVLFQQKAYKLNGPFAITVGYFCH